MAVNGKEKKGQEDYIRKLGVSTSSRRLSLYIRMKLPQKFTDSGKKIKKKRDRRIISENWE
jgi:hypothetical protein